MTSKEIGTYAIAACALLLPCAVVAAERPVRDVVRGEVSAPVTPFVFDGDVRDLPAPPEWKPGDPIREIPRRHYPEGKQDVPEAANQGIDPLLSLQDRTGLTTDPVFVVPSRNFAGQGFSGVNPPDTVGAVGPNHYIQAINTGGGTSIRIYDKAEPTPTVLATFVLDSLGGGSCASGLGDPVVLYDRFADRWVLTEFSSGGNNICMYVSQTPDPLSGGWFAYGFVSPSFPDYPKYGVWPTDANGGMGSYVYTTNESGCGVYAVPRDKMLAGLPASSQRFVVPDLPGFPFNAVTPADVDGPNAPPTGAPAVIMRQRDTEVHGGPPAPADVLEQWHFQVNWTTPASTTLVQQPNIDVAELESDLCGLSAFACFPQPGTGTTLDPLREVIMNRLQYWNFEDYEALAGNFVTDVDGTNHGGVRWFELRRTGGGPWTLHQEGVYAPDIHHRWMAASALDQSGNFAIAYNVSSTTVFPSLRYTGRMVDDPAGTLSQPETSIHAGTASNSSNRYGDYAAMNIDPSDDCTFWFTGMDNTSSSWRTQITSFRFDACGCELEPLPLSILADVGGSNQVDVSWDDSELATVVEYHVQRSRTPGGPYDTIAVVPDSSPGVGNGVGYLFEDTTVSGTIDYYYVVVATDGSACKSTSNEETVTATGQCTLAPVFGGLQTVGAPNFETCTLQLQWPSAADECGGPVSYNVYRSGSPGFTPGPANLLVSGLTSTAFDDFDGLVDGTAVYYIVRSVDVSNGVEDGNLVQRTATPQGQLLTGTYDDDAGDTGAAELVPSGPWFVSTNEGVGGSRAYKTGNYPNSTCSALVMPSMRLLPGATLTFSSRYDIENGPDKGVVQISTNGGSTWTKLPVNYPGSSATTSDACGLATGTYFTGTNLTYATYTASLSTWVNQTVLIRFLISSNGSNSLSGWWLDNIAVSNSEIAATCTTGSACADNPFVDVVPDGPLTECLDSAPTLNASLVSGNGPFAYQWFRDGQPIPGATGPAFQPQTLDTHRYNCGVKSASCLDDVPDGLDTILTLQNRPVFGGITSVVDPKLSTCTLNVGWNAATTVCDGPVRYFVYRDTTTPVATTPENLVASHLSGTSLADDGNLAVGGTYHYLVKALDLSTGIFDDNVAQASGTPTGPQSGIQTPLNETFSAATFAQWTVTTGPGPHNCGAWALSTSATQRPAGSTGDYAFANSDCGGVLPRTSTIMTSPAVNLVLPGTTLSITLEADLYFNHDDGGDTATVEVWNGTQWIVLWTDPNADVNQHMSWNVMPYAAGNPAFRVRFNYQNGQQDFWFSVDNVKITTNVLNNCSTNVGPSPVPDGAGPSNPMHADRLDDAGTSIGLTWDVTCAAPSYHLLYGDLANVGTYALSGNVCGLGTSGSFNWNSVPAGSLYFLVVSSDGAGTEGSWGHDSFGGERNGPVGSGACGTTSKDTSGSCP